MLHSGTPPKTMASFHVSLGWNMLILQSILTINTPQTRFYSGKTHSGGVGDRNFSRDNRFNIAIAFINIKRQFALSARDGFV